MAKSADIRPASRWPAPSARSVTTLRLRTVVTRPTVLSSRSSARAAASRPCTARLVDRKYHSFTKPGPFGWVLRIASGGEWQVRNQYPHRVRNGRNPASERTLAGVLSFRAAKTAEIPRHLRSDAGVLPFQPMIASISHLRH